MEGLQAWFEPLLWVIGTLTAIIAFIRFCKPIWNSFSSSKELIDTIGLLNNKLDTHFTDADEKFSKIEESLEKQINNIERLTEQNKKEDTITLSLLHDAIVQIYQEAKENGFISEVSYFRACELYKQDGNSQYIDNIMVALGNMHEENINKNKQENK